MEQGWDSLPPELLRRVVSLLRSEWAFFPPERPSDCIRAIRGTCKAWQSTVDADVQAVAATVPLAAPAALALRLPNVTALDLSRYPRNCMELSPMLQHLRLRSLVLADPWDPPAAIPVQWLGALTHLSLLADGMVVGRLAAQLCQALGKLQQLRHLQLSRLQLSTPAAQMLAQAFGDLPHLSHVQLSGGAAPVQGHDLHELLNVDLLQLRTLELVRLGVRALPRSVTRLAGLTRLSLCGEMLRSMHLDHELLALPDLAVLDISANLAEQLPPSVLLLTGLRELHAGMNRLGLANHDFGTMQALQVLVLASNKLLGLHDSVWGLVGLRRLDLGHNNLTDLPQAVSSLTALTYLNVCHNFLTALPAGVGCLVGLVELDVSLNTDMRELPAGLGALSCLTRLVASHMRLKQLPIDIGGMVALEHLDVSHNSLHHLAPQLSSLTALTHLEASDNKLHQSTAVPEELVTLASLKVLRLARNRLQSLPEALGAFSALQVLDCSGNRLTSVPRVVGRCTALQQLQMASNRLRGLTSGIGNLMRLQLLDLSHNQYRHLPTMTGDLTQLAALLLEDNQLEDLPSSCSSLCKLTQLTLSANRLHVLPPAIVRMSALRHLSLDDNPLLGRDAVLLQLQRQLPALSVDGWGPLRPQGAGAPGGDELRAAAPHHTPGAPLMGLTPFALAATPMSPMLWPTYDPRRRQGAQVMHGIWRSNLPVRPPAFDAAAAARAAEAAGGHTTAAPQAGAPQQPSWVVPTAADVAQQEALAAQMAGLQFARGQAECHQRQLQVMQAQVQAAQQGAGGAGGPQDGAGSSSGGGAATAAAAAAWGVSAPPLNAHPVWGMPSQAWVWPPSQGHSEAPLEMHWLRSAAPRQQPRGTRQQQQQQQEQQGESAAERVAVARKHGNGVSFAEYEAEMALRIAGGGGGAAAAAARNAATPHASDGSEPRSSLLSFMNDGGCRFAAPGMPRAASMDQLLEGGRQAAQQTLQQRNWPPSGLRPGAHAESRLQPRAAAGAAAAGAGAGAGSSSSSSHGAAAAAAGVPGSPSQQPAGAQSDGEVERLMATAAVSAAAAAGVRQGDAATDTPSSAPDTECEGSDSSSEVNEAAPVNATTPPAAGGQAMRDDAPAALAAGGGVRHAQLARVRAVHVSSSAGGTSSGGGASSCDGAGSSAGATSQGRQGDGSSTGDSSAGGASPDARAARVDGPAAAAAAGQQGPPPAAPGAAQGRPAVRSGFPFNVLENAWWGG